MSLHICSIVFVIFECLWFRSCGMYNAQWNSFLITGGIVNGVATAATWDFWYPYPYPNYDLNVPRYYHACGSYTDPQTNLQVIIQ